MDQRGGKEEHSCQEPSDHQRKRKDDAAAVPEGLQGESTDRRDGGGLEAQTAGVIVKEQVEVVEGEASVAPLLAHACSLLQLLLLLRACDGCLVGLLHGCSDDDPNKSAADDDDIAAAAVAESPTQEGEGGGDDGKAAGTGSEVATPVLAARRPPPPPGPPEEGSGGHGGNHN